jgi:tRNA-binding protein
MERIEPDDFFRADIRIGTIERAHPFPEARKPAYRLEIDFGPEYGRLVSSAQITDRYRPEELTGRQVAAVVNFPPRQIGPVSSQCLVLGVSDAGGGIILLQPERPVPNGQRIH